MSKFLFLMSKCHYKAKSTGKIYICMYMYIYFCDVLLITNQRLYFNRGALLGELIFFQAFVLHLDHWPWKNVLKWRKIDVLPMCYKWIRACCSIRGLGGFLPVPWMWFRASGGMIRALFSVWLAGLVVLATSLCDHPFNLPLTVCLHKSVRGEVFLFLLSRVSWVRGAIFTFSPFKKW